MDCSIGASFLSRTELPLLSLCQSCAAAAGQLQLFIDSAWELQALRSLCQWAFFSAGAYGQCDGVGGPLLLMLAAGGLTAEVSADCLAGLFYALGHAQL